MIIRYNIDSILLKKGITMRHIIFLDIDGVLNIVSKSYCTYKHRKELIEPHLVQRFNYLLDEALKENEDIDIVISSSWRFDMDNLFEMLKNSGFSHIDLIKGKTTLSPLITKRGEQIFRYFEENTGKDDVINVHYKCYIIDDETKAIKAFFENDTIYSNDIHIIDVDSTTGISDKNVGDILDKFREGI